MSSTVRLYHFIGDKWGLESISKRRLKVAFPDQVNDLFEFRPFDFGEVEMEKRFRLAWQKAIKEYSTEQGFISFSKTWSVPTMWAHYADNHKGICLGFDLPIGSEDGASYVSRIKYKKKLIPMDNRIFGDEAYKQKMIEIAKITKSKHWKYEKEWRYWFSLIENGPEQKRADPNLLVYNAFDERLVLREVIFGHRSELSTNKVQKLLNPTDAVTFTTARPSFRAFKMARQALKENQK